MLFGKDNGVLNFAPVAVQLGRSAVGKTGIDDLYKVNKPRVDYVVVEYKFDSTGAVALIEPLNAVSYAVQSLRTFAVPTA